MSRLKPILAILLGGSLLSLGFCLAFVAFLNLVVFREGSLTRNYSDQEAVANFWNGIAIAAGSIGALLVGAALTWWGARHREPPK